jgi:hypothetical protein
METISMDLVRMAMRVAAHAIDEDEDLGFETGENVIFMGVEHPSTMNADDAIKAAKVIIESKGYSTGEYQIVQIVNNSNVVFNLETDPKFVNDLETNVYFEATDGVVTVSAEMP